MDPEKIGQFICQLRKEKNLSQYQLADLVPISRQGVSKWERGVTTPDPQTLLKLGELFDVSIDELLKGERIPVKSIESLEQTTLSILDQNIKKTQTIRRITAISVTVITILLLSFLSYYFINSYNSIQIYKIANTGDKFTITNGMFITTREKYYLKLGKIKKKINAEINNIGLYYKKGNKKVLLIEDTDIDKIMIMDSYGYKEKLTKSDINKLRDNLYLEITYNGHEKETIKLRYTRDYNNNSLFFMNQKQGSVKVIVTKEEKETPAQEPKKEESKPVVKEIKQPAKQSTQQVKDKPQQKESTKQDNEQEEPVKEEKKQEEQVQEEPLEPVITTEQIITKIKENCTNMNGRYTCSYDNYNVIIMYDESINKLTIYNERKYIGDYQINEDAYVCLVQGCEQTIKGIIKEYLFS